MSAAPPNKRIGIVAVQGAFARHAEMFRQLGVGTVEVRTPSDLDGVDAVALPGGESTTIAKMLRGSGLRDALAEQLAAGLPAFGTCAGAILLADEILDPVSNDDEPLGIVGVAVRRNAFGRQLDSFESDLEVAGLGAEPFRAVFIRAPWFENPAVGVEVLAWQNDKAVMVAAGPVLLCTFHPELTGDTRIHEMFLELA